MPHAQDLASVHLQSVALWFYVAHTLPPMALNAIGPLIAVLEEVGRLVAVRRFSAPRSEGEERCKSVEPNLEH